MHIPGSELLQALQSFRKIVLVDEWIYYKLKQLACGQDSNASTPEECVYMGYILSQEVKSTRVIQIHSLTHINDVQLVLQDHKES